MNHEPLPAQGPADVNVGRLPVAYAVFANNGDIRIWSQDREPVRKLAEAKGLPLVPLYPPMPLAAFPRQPNGEGGWVIETTLLRAIREACPEEWQPSEEEIEAVLLVLERMTPPNVK